MQLGVILAATERDVINYWWETLIKLISLHNSSQDGIMPPRTKFCTTLIFSIPKVTSMILPLDSLRIIGCDITITIP